MSLDAVIVGGGLAGSVLAKQLALAGCRVLVLEQELAFKDRVRGENMLPWGVAAARRLGIVDDLAGAGAHPTPSWITYMMGQRVSDRDLPATTPGGDASLNIYHPAMQEAMLQSAGRAGAEVCRGAKVIAVEPASGGPPSVTFERDGKRQTVTARIVVGADGRESQVRQWTGFETRRNPDLLMIAGCLLEGTRVPDHAVHLSVGPGCLTLWAPLGDGRARAYFVYSGASGRKQLSGPGKVGDFLDLCRSTGLDPSWIDRAEAAGPLAEFSGADRWVEAPAKNGVALIGDAAASSDPSWGCGLSLTLLDVENLSRELLATSDWNAALSNYARLHDTSYGALSRILSWMTELMWTPGPEADERRSRVFPRMMAEPEGFPDNVGQGPFGPSDETARRLVLGLA